MQWVNEGPDIPDEILQAQDEGRLLFFCGAGVSTNAGLCSFEKLVRSVFKKAKCESLLKSDPVINKEFKAHNFDIVLNHLEQQEVDIRTIVSDLLTLKKNADLFTHIAILKLSKVYDKDNYAIRLVTTNFDHGFILDEAKEEVEKDSFKIVIDKAPSLPVPKPYKWNSVVYLHGVLEEKNHLVLTSADFGAAYITEGWAARFVTEMFEHFTVLFVGYSIEDKVLRYITDAIAYDKRHGLGKGLVYALAGHKDNNKEKIENSWKAKNVIPILYNEKEKHKLLHQTLIQWSENFEAGFYGRTNVINQFASNKPLKNDYETEQVLWALDDNSGNCAKVFSEFTNIDEQPASIEWLNFFYERDLKIINAKRDYRQLNDKSKYVDDRLNDLCSKEIFVANLVYPYYSSSSDLSNISLKLADWLCKHLNEEILLEWVLERGGILHHKFAEKIMETLTFNYCPLLEIVHKTWQFLVSNIDRLSLLNTMKTPLYKIIKTPFSILPFPEKIISNKFNIHIELNPLNESYKNYLRQGSYDRNYNKFFEIKFKLEDTDFDDDEFKVLVGNIEDLNNLPWLVDNLTSHLIYIMSVKSFFDKKNDANFSLSHEIPSIIPHNQNCHEEKWVYLVELLFQTFKCLIKKDFDYANLIIYRWKSTPYLIFKRLVLASVADNHVLSIDDKVKMLLAGNCYLLWNRYVKREKFQLIKAIWQDFPKGLMGKLVSAIIKGPSRSFYKKTNCVGHNIRERIDREIFCTILHIKEFYKYSIPKRLELKLKELKKMYPQ